MSDPLLSVTVITRNEAHRIARCLGSVAVADEQVVLDSGSTDDTVAQARSLGARVIQSADWPGFGQNIVGRLRIRVLGEPGDRVVVRHAEVLEHDRLGVRPLRTAKATDTYVLADAGGRTQLLEPCFTFHGFRYAEVVGVDALAPDDVTGVVIGSDLRRTGWCRWPRGRPRRR